MKLQDRINRMKPYYIASFVILIILRICKRFFFQDIDFFGVDLNMITTQYFIGLALISIPFVYFKNEKWLYLIIVVSLIINLIFSVSYLIKFFQLY